MHSYYKYENTEIFTFSSFFDILQSIKKLNLYNKIFIICDEIVRKIYDENFFFLLKELSINHKQILIPSREESKSIEQVIDIWNFLSSSGADRHSLIISLGGGVINDLSGFIASTYMRGIDYISIPTTLLCMVDASIGGKVGINFDLRKNLIGAFYHPKAIYICPEFLKTLPQREFSSGLAEIIKAAVISGEDFFSMLEKSISNLQSTPPRLEEAIANSCKIKIDLITHDIYEKNGMRSLLNYGHTFGHAIEILTSYEFTHGESISIGMSCAAYVAKKMGFVNEDFILRQDALCKAAKLPTKLPPIDIYDLVNQLKRDKKNNSEKITLILPKKVGKVINLPNISETIILESLIEKRDKDVLDRA